MQGGLKPFKIIGTYKDTTTKTLQPMEVLVVIAHSTNGNSTSISVNRISTSTSMGGNSTGWKIAANGTTGQVNDSASIKCTFGSINSKPIVVTVAASVPAYIASSTYNAFAAVHEDGSVNAWGCPTTGGSNSAAVSGGTNLTVANLTDIKTIYSTGTSSDTANTLPL